MTSSSCVKSHLIGEKCSLNDSRHESLEENHLVPPPVPHELIVKYDNTVYSAYYQIVTIHISKNRNDLKKRNDLKTSHNFQAYLDFLCFFILTLPVKLVPFIFFLKNAVTHKIVTTLKLMVELRSM